MPSDSKFTRDDDGNVAVRVVSNTGVSEQPESMFTTDEDGNVAVRVVFGEGGGGGGGSDQHNLGWYATQAALEEAHPTAEAGDWAIVGATDTVWIWDTDNSEWVDSDKKGQVTSVNNQTGAVTVSEVPSQTGNAGKFLTTDGTDASWSDKPLVNTATQPESGALGISATVTGYEALGIKTIKGFGTRSITIGAGSETQAGSESEMAIGRTSQAAGSYACAIGNQAKAYGANCHAIGYNAVAGDYRYYSTYGAWQFGSGTNSEAGTVCFALTTSNDYQHWTNYKLLDSDGTIPSDRLVHAINKYSTMPTAASTNEGWIVQFTGTTDSTYTHGHLYECMSDGQDPATYSWTEVQLGGGGLPDQTGHSGELLTTDGTDASWGLTVGGTFTNYYSGDAIKLNAHSGHSSDRDIKFRVTTDSLLIGFGNNFVYRNEFCFSWQNNAFFPINWGTGISKTLGTSSYKWGNIYVEKINNGADITVPNATGEMVVNKATDSTSVSILGESNGYSKSVAVGQNAMTRGETVAVGYSSQVESRNIAIGYAASAKTSFGGSVAIGHSANADISSAGWKASVAIGPNAKANASGSIQISATKSNSTTVTPTNTDANTFKVSNDNGNYEMMSADGTIPTARLTKVNSTITLAAADWNSNTQTVNVTGMTATGVVFVGPDPTDQSAYTSAGILCTAQAAGTLTFTCDTVPSGDIDVNVVML